MQRILTEEDFERIKRLKQRRMVEAAMAKHGLKSTAQRRRLKEALGQVKRNLNLNFECVRHADETMVEPG